MVYLENRLKTCPNTFLNSEKAENCENCEKQKK